VGKQEEENKLIAAEAKYRQRRWVEFEELATRSVARDRLGEATNRYGARIYILFHISRGTFLKNS
jgi:hypothetical protein